VYREHTMSPNDAFLRRVWPRVKGSIQYLIKQDGNGNGVLEGKQMNTLDAAWYGPISWLSSLYIGALLAGSAMAREMGDEAFARECDTLAQRGGQWVSENLFNGEYFYQERDPAHPEVFGSGIGCHIDQVFGQGWAHQLGLERVLPKDKTQLALKSLWRYNFTPDVGPYRERYKTGRWYAMPGEAGLIMCTFPKGGEREARGDKPTHGFAGYFNECMNGFEYQAAGHMIAEGLVQQGLAVTRAVHDRYHPSRRNPYNEIECGDHYARSMASHGVFVSVCGFEHHGPKGYIGFSPRLTPENFRSAFIAAEGWGTFAQKRDDRLQTETLRLNFGHINLNQMAFDLAEGKSATAVKVKLDGDVLEVNHHMAENRAFISLVQTTAVKADQLFEIEIST
jgi:non-lysosomal glucosylceramidase